ncbi:hypothetical protein NE235_01895 [Actinoallomurus spadix]|uniref:hypothetical protein n=1 Tax=Actinoallomurus spadix TaxID=79912 RepID=UPI002093D022|nr:hypothetical protein [Actinoallomurus spadix]MCO5984854.1 hypothetical protein [Actinoallomurus spadix]
MTVRPSGDRAGTAAPSDGAADKVEADNGFSARLRFGDAGAITARNRSLFKVTYRMAGMSFAARVGGEVRGG